MLRIWWRTRCYGCPMRAERASPLIFFFADQGGRESMQVHLKWWALNGVSGVQWAGTHDVEIADVSAERTNGTDDRMAGTASYQQQGRSKHR